MEGSPHLSVTMCEWVVGREREGGGGRKERTCMGGKKGVEGKEKVKGKERRGKCRGKGGKKGRERGKKKGRGV